MYPYNCSPAIGELFLLKPFEFLINESIIAYLKAILVVALCTLIGSLCYPYVDTSNLIMLYLLGVVAIAKTNTVHRGPSFFTALLATLAFDFFFIPPYFSVAVSDTQYFFTLIVMLAVAQTISHLTISIRKQSEAAQKAIMQTETEKLRNILLTSISHDLRTPLAAIMGSASILIHPETLNSATTKDLAKNIFNESKRLNNQVNNILQMIRLESRTVQITRRDYALSEVVENALDRLDDIIGERVVKIHMANHMPLVPFDFILIQQVLVNLIENALKYTAPYLPIEIQARVSGKNALIKIADCGPGLNEEELQNIFSKFYRSKKMGNNDEGFGLGLAICKNIIQIHEGKIWAENRKGGGALFYFTLPLKV